MSGIKRQIHFVSPLPETIGGSPVSSGQSPSSLASYSRSDADLSSSSSTHTSWICTRGFISLPFLLLLLPWSPLNVTFSGSFLPPLHTTISNSYCHRCSVTNGTTVSSLFSNPRHRAFQGGWLLNIVIQFYIWKNEKNSVFSLCWEFKIYRKTKRK